MSPLPFQNARTVTEICFSLDDTENVSFDPLYEGCKREGIIIDETALDFSLNILLFEIKDKYEKGVIKGVTHIGLLVEGEGWGFQVKSDGIPEFGALYRHGEMLPLFYGHIFF